MGNVCNVASKSYNISKGLVGLISLGISIYSYIIGSLVESIFLSAVFVFTFGDTVLNWSKYKLLEREWANLNKHNNQLENENNKFINSNKTLRDTNEILKREINIMEKHNNRLSDNINDLTDNTIVLSGKITDLEKINDRHKKIVDNLSVENKTLQTNVEKMKQIQINSRKLINSLMTAGDDYKEFNKIFENNINQLQDTEKILNILVNEMRSDTFLDMDENNDGIITTEEYDKFFSKKKKKFSLKGRKK